MAFAHKAAQLLSESPRAFDADSTGESLLQIKPNEEGRIGIDELRFAKRFAMLTSEGRRVVILQSLDDVSTEGCNALLKILEEPPPKVFFFLLSEGRRRVPATIRSRARQMRFTAAAGEEVGKLLMGEADEAKLRALRFLSDDLPSRAEALLRDDGEGDRLRVVHEAVKNLPAVTPRQILAVINCFKRDGGSPLWGAWQRAVLRWLLAHIEASPQAAPEALEVWERLTTIFNGYRSSYLDPRQVALAVFYQCWRLSDTR